MANDDPTVLTDLEITEVRLIPREDALEGCHVQAVGDAEPAQ